MQMEPKLCPRVTRSGSRILTPASGSSPGWHCLAPEHGLSPGGDAHPWGLSWVMGAVSWVSLSLWLSWVCRGMEMSPCIQAEPGTTEDGSPWT